MCFVYHDDCITTKKKLEKKIGAYFTASRRQAKTSDVSNPDKIPDLSGQV